MRGIKIGHELADQFTTRFHRHERQCADALRQNGRLQSRIDIGALDVIDRDRLRVSRVPRPWRMALNSLSVGLRKAARADEGHNPLLVDKQNCRALAAKCASDGVERSIVNMGESGCAAYR